MVLVILVAIWLVLFITKGRFLKPYFERFVSHDLLRKTTVAGEFNLYFAPFNIAFRADGLSIDNPAWAQRPQLFTANHLALTLRTWPLLFGQHKVSSIAMDGARVDAEWDAAHKRNSWTFDGPPRPLPIPDIARGTVTDTTIRYTDPVMQLDSTVNIHPLQATNQHIQQVLGFDGSASLHDKTMHFAGKVEQADAALLHGGGAGLVVHATGANTIIDLSGKMPGLTEVSEGKYRLSVRGENMADLFKFIGVVVVPTRAYHLAANVAQEDGDWAFRNIAGAYGNSDLGGWLVIHYADARLHLAADMRTRSLDLLDAAPFIGYDPKRLDALGTKGLVTQAGGHPRILPDAPLKSAALGEFDADVRYRVGAIVAKNFPVSSLDVTLSLDHGLMKLNPARAVVATGRVEGNFTLDARAPTVVTDYDVHMFPTPMSKLFARFGVNEAGTTGVLSARVKMRGQGNSLRESLATSNGRIAFIVPAGTIWAGNLHLSELNLGGYVEKALGKRLKEPVTINCGLLGFTVRDGISTLDPVLVDTSKSVLTGTGEFSFRDESLDMSIRDKSKHISLFSLQSPIGVHGYFAAPGIQIVTPQLLRRAGASVALGVVATPLAALLAFVDPGTGKATACGPVLAGARAASQMTTKGQPRTDVGVKH